MKYEFHVADYVETKTGTVGFITNVVDAENKQAHWMPTKLSSVDIRDDLYSLDESYCIIEMDIEKRFKRIGQYDFTKKDKGKIESLVKSWILEDADGKGEYYFDSREAIKKINELVEAVNELRDKND